MENIYKWKSYEVVDFWEAFPKFEATEQVKNKITKICAWCPDKEEKDHLALSKWYRLTHSICPDCFWKEMLSVRKMVTNRLNK